MAEDLRFSKPRIENFLYSLGIAFDVVEIPKDFYYLPTEEWLLGVFLETIKAEQPAYQLPWKFVCRDAARQAAAIASRLWGQSAGSPADGGLLLGEFRYRKEREDANHDTGWTLRASNNGRQLELILFESLPTDRRISRWTDLTEKERTSCFGVCA